MKNKIVTDKDRIKHLESEITELEEIVSGYVQENEHLAKKIADMKAYELDIETENANFQTLIKNNTLILILMFQMSILCGKNSAIGRAFKAAIKAYQKNLVDKLLNSVLDGDKHSFEDAYDLDDDSTNDLEGKDDE